MGGISARISAAITRGALRSWRASCEGRGDAQLAEAGLLGRLDNYLRFNAIADLQISRYTLGDALFNVMEHKKTSIAAARRGSHI